MVSKATAAAEDVKISNTSQEGQEVIEFVEAEARLLDEGRYEEWLDLFADDGFYWAPIDRQQTDPTSHVSLFYDSKEFLATRIERLRHPQIHVQIPASRCSRMMTGYRVWRNDDDPGYRVEAKYLAVEYRTGHPQQMHAGDVSFEIKRRSGRMVITQKKVLLVNSDGVFPALAVPF